MEFRIKCHLGYEISGPASFSFNIAVAQNSFQRISTEHFEVSGADFWREIVIGGQRYYRITIFGDAVMNRMELTMQPSTTRRNGPQYTTAPISNAPSAVEVRKQSESAGQSQKATHEAPLEGNRSAHPSLAEACPLKPDQSLLPNRFGKPMTRTAVQQRLQLHVRTAQANCPSLRRRRISPYTIRHATAMNLLQSGVAAPVIALWLGHEDPAHDPSVYRSRSPHKGIGVATFASAKRKARPV